MENNLIYGKRYQDFFINENELQFIKNHTFNNIMSNEEKKVKLMTIFKKVGLLSVVQNDIYSILNGFELSKLNNPNNYNNFITQFIEKQNINENFRKNKNKSVSNSIFILYLLLNNILKYIEKKKLNFNKIINSNNINKINQVYKEIRYLIKKFLKFREKIYTIIQLKYIEQPISKKYIKK